MKLEVISTNDFRRQRVKVISPRHEKSRVPKQGAADDQS